MSAILDFPDPALPIARDDMVELADGRRALVCEVFTLSTGNSYVNACPYGSRDSVIDRVENVRRVEAAR